MDKFIYQSRFRSQPSLSLSLAICIDVSICQYNCLSVYLYISYVSDGMSVINILYYQFLLAGLTSFKHV